MKEQLIKWLTEFCRWKKIDEFVFWAGETSSPEEYKIQLNIYTHDNDYRITAVEKYDHGHLEHTYLGCVVSARKPRAGEGWTRGRDLPDGPFSQKTWNKIKNAIIAWELVKISKPKRSEPVTENKNTG